MRKLILLVAAVFLLAAFAPLAAHAQAAPNVGYEKGFFIKTDDEQFKLTLNGRFQPYFGFQKKTGQNQVLSFFLRRANLGFKANIAEVVKMGFTLQHDMTDVSLANASTTFATVNVIAASVSVDVIPEFTVAVGMVGLPLDLIGNMSSNWFVLTEAPITSTQTDGLKAQTPLRSSFGVSDGLGVNLSGGYWKWYYSASVINGAESNYTMNLNRKMSYGFATGFNILGDSGAPSGLTDFACSDTPQLTVNAGTQYQSSRTDTNTAANIKYIWTSSLGTSLRWGGFALTTEGYYRKTRITSIGTAVWSRPRLTDVGYYAAAGYYVIPKKFEVAAQVGQIFRQGPDNDSWQFGGGLNWYIFDDNLKMQLAYMLTTDFDDITGTQSRKFHNVILGINSSF